MVTVKLARSIEHNGQIVAEVKLDLEALEGIHLELCAREAEARTGQPVRVLATDLAFHTQIAAQASGLDVAVIRRLKAPDFMRVVQEVQYFLLRGDSPKEEQPSEKSER